MHRISHVCMQSYPSWISSFLLCNAVSYVCLMCYGLCLSYAYVPYVYSMACIYLMSRFCLMLSVFLMPYVYLIPYVYLMSYVYLNAYVYPVPSVYLIPYVYLMSCVYVMLMSHLKPSIYLVHCLSYPLCLSNLLCLSNALCLFGLVPLSCFVSILSFVSVWCLMSAFSRHYSEADGRSGGARDSPGPLLAPETPTGDYHVSIQFLNLLKPLVVAGRISLTLSVQTTNVFKVHKRRLIGFPWLVFTCRTVTSLLKLPLEMLTEPPWRPYRMWECEVWCTYGCWC